MGEGLFWLIHLVADFRQPRRLRTHFSMTGKAALISRRGSRRTTRVEQPATIRVIPKLCSSKRHREKILIWTSERIRFQRTIRAA